MGAQLVKSVAADANAEAGDGTTTATVLAQAIYTKGLEAVDAGNNPVLVKRGIDFAISKVILKLKEISTPVSDVSILTQVATISANNDYKLGAMIAEAISAVGNNGIVSVEEATGNETVIEYVDGLKLARGWVHESFVTNQGKLTCEMDDALVLLYDDKVQSVNELVDILNHVIEVGRPLLMVFKDIDFEALSHIVLNKINNVIRCCVIKAPGFGDHRKAYLEDIAVLTGGKVYSSMTSQGLRGASLQDLGQARKIIVGPNYTNIIDGRGDPAIIKQTLLNLQDALNQEDIFEHQKDIISNRVSRLSGGVAVFKVGGTSESEMREKKDRVEDAINAVKSALTEGVVPGGGSALLHCISALLNLTGDEVSLPEYKVGVEIIRHALEAPFKQILTNAGVDAWQEEIAIILNKSEKAGFNALELCRVDDMLKEGIIDPTKVVRSALEHAASASGTLLTTEVTIIDSDADLR